MSEKKKKERFEFSEFLVAFQNFRSLLTDVFFLFCLKEIKRTAFFPHI